MNKYAAVSFVFNIAEEIKRSFENPVIFLTLNDYAEGIYKTLTDIHAVLLHNAPSEDISRIVNSFYIAWLKAVREVKELIKRVTNLPRQEVQDAIEFTIRCVYHRYANFNVYQQNIESKMTIEDRLILQANLEIIKDMKDTVISILQDKSKSFMYSADHTDFVVKASYEIEELFNWLDRLNDNVAIQICRAVHLPIPQFPRDLANTLKNIIDEVLADPIAANYVEKAGQNDKLVCPAVRFDASHDLELSKIVDNIKCLEDRIKKLKRKDSSFSSALALQHKVIYLEERVQSLENLKVCLNALKSEQNTENREDKLWDNIELNIFNHNLPNLYCSRFVEKSLMLWENALTGNDSGKSITSILSPSDSREFFFDEMGQFTLDDYGRKLYIKENDKLYQLNEKNELVELSDDNQHVYFYDDCGRYYINSATNTRIYKDHENASEYELLPDGKLVKVNEVINGIEYKFDNQGRYYINEQGKAIYTDPESGRTYEIDDFGNLVQTESIQWKVKSGPEEPMIVEENKYLKHSVGEALKICLANVLLHQPADPIGFLADNLEKYHNDLALKQKRRENQKALATERDKLARATDLKTENDTMTLHSYVTSEETSQTCLDTNFMNYKTDYDFL